MPQGAGAGQSIANATFSGQSPVGSASLLAQSADELAFGLAAKVQERTLKERKVSESRLMRPDRARVQTLMQAFANKGGQAAAAESAASQQLAALAKRIKDKPSSARQEAQDELGNDPTLQYLGLLSLAYQNQDGSSGGDPGGGSESALWEAIEELSAEKGDRIAADLNTFEATQGLPPEQAQAFRGAYKDVVLASESLAQAGQHILSATQGDSG
jgi:hypothetical protein